MKWNTELPEDSDDVIVALANGGVTFGFYSLILKTWLIVSEYYDEEDVEQHGSVYLLVESSAVTHWMPLPKHPVQ